MANILILSETRKHYARSQTHGRHIVRVGLLRIYPCPQGQDPVTYFRDSMEEILEISLLNVEATDMVGFQIMNSCQFCRYVYLPIRKFRNRPHLP
jgi:hypothetical protein